MVEMLATAEQTTIDPETTDDKDFEMYTAGLPIGEYTESEEDRDTLSGESSDTDTSVSDSNDSGGNNGYIKILMNSMQTPHDRHREGRQNDGGPLDRIQGMYPSRASRRRHGRWAERLHP